MYIPLNPRSKFAQGYYQMLGEAVAAPKEAFRASVHLRDGQNNDLGTLGYVILRPG